MIELTDISKKFDDKIAVDGLTLRVDKGEILGFLGPNGAGKTTTVKMLTGMLAPTSGSAKVAGFDIREATIEVKKRIGYVPESGAVFESMSAWEYLEMVSELHHLDRNLAGRRISEFLSLFGIYDEKDQQLNHYSKGMKQKILLIAALLHNPDVLFLDEPLNGLDANAARVIKEVLRKFSGQGKTIMFCSHILEVVERICTRIAIIDHGRIVADGSPHDIKKATSRSTLEQAFASLTNSQDEHVFSERISAGIGTSLMLAAVFNKFGIDYRQFVVLTRAFLKRDFRASSMSVTLRHGRTGKRTFLILVFFYLTSGFVFIPVILSVTNIFLAATLLMTYTMIMIGGLIVVEYYSIVIAQEDYYVLGFQPISPRTFTAVKFANILFYVLVFSTILALPGIVSFTFVVGYQPLLSIIAFVAVFLCNVFVATCIITLYVFLIKKIPLYRLQNILAFFQVGLAFVIYSSFFVLPRITDLLTAGAERLANATWIYLLPAAWFASFLNIVSGPIRMQDVCLSLMALTFLLGVSGLAISRLSIGYAMQLASLSEDKPNPQRRRLSPFYFFANANEERVVSKLIRLQFMNDNKFKMAVLGILPLTMFYLLLGMEDGPLLNPFEYPALRLRNGFLYLLIFLFPMMLRTYVTTSDSYQSSWIFHTTPVNVKRIVLAEKNFLMIYFVLPFLLLLAIVFYYFFDNLLHVLLHILVLGILAHMFLQFAFLYAPDLPFSRPNIKGGRSLNVAMLLIFVPFIIYLGLPLIFKYVYSNTGSFITFTAVSLTVSLILEKLIQVRVVSYQNRFEFLG